MKLLAIMVSLCASTAVAQSTIDLDIAIARARQTAAAPALRPLVKLPVAPKAKPAYVHRGYPVSGRGWWYQPGGQVVTWRHLLQGEHAGKFDANWLHDLNTDELQSLHADDHTGRVQWQYVVRPQSATVIRQPAVTYSAPVSSCPNGRCPNASQSYVQPARVGIFGRRR